MPTIIEKPESEDSTPNVAEATNFEIESSAQAKLVAKRRASFMQMGLKRGIISRVEEAKKNFYNRDEKEDGVPKFKTYPDLPKTIYI